MGTAKALSDSFQPLPILTRTLLNIVVLMPVTLNATGCTPCSAAVISNPDHVVGYRTLAIVEASYVDDVYN